MDSADGYTLMVNVVDADEVISTDWLMAVVEFEANAKEIVDGDAVMVVCAAAIPAVSAGEKNHGRQANGVRGHTSMEPPGFSCSN